MLAFDQFATFRMVSVGSPAEEAFDVEADLVECALDSVVSIPARRRVSLPSGQYWRLTRVCGVSRPLGKGQ